MSPRDLVSADSVLSPARALPTVNVIDTDPSVRASLELLICSIGWRAELFTSAEQFLAAPLSAAPGCVISEILLPGLSGLDLQARLLGQDSIPMIFLTSHLNVSVTVRAMKAGAVEFLTKPCRPDALIQALRNAIERSQIAIHHAVELRSLRERYATLSEREREVMSLVVTGLLNKQVGHRLCISEITVKAHRGKVMRKMQADSLPTLVCMAAMLGLPWPPSAARLDSPGVQPRPMPGRDSLQLLAAAN